MTGIGLICDLKLSYLNHFVHVREVEILLLLCNITPVKMCSNHLQMQCSKIEDKMHMLSNAVVMCFACSVLKVFDCSACSVLNHLVCLASCVLSHPCCCCVGHSIITWWVHVILVLSVSNTSVLCVVYTCYLHLC